MPTHMKGYEGILLAKTHIQSLRTLGPLGGASESASCWQSHVLLCPSLYLLYATLTRLLGFAFEP
jgi:hypothetical protein